MIDPLIQHSRAKLIMPLSKEVPQPEVFCTSDVHTKKIHASWLVSLLGQKGEHAFCSSCVFLLRRADQITAGARIPVATMSVSFPSNLSADQLNTEIQGAMQQARMQGYWSDDCLYTITNEGGAVVVTFRRSGPVLSG